MSNLPQQEHECGTAKEASSSEGLSLFQLLDALRGMGATYTVMGGYVSLRTGDGEGSRLLFNADWTTEPELTEAAERALAAAVQAEKGD